MAKKTTTTIRDKGMRKALTGLKSLQGYRVKVGVLQGAGSYEKGPTVALVAAANEFGAPSVGVPERSFIRSNMDAKEGEYYGQLRNIAEAVSKGADAKQQLGRFALGVRSDIRKNLVNISEPPNAPATIARKKSSNPLVDTGHLHQSINSTVEKDR